jgi:hypothetical protein
MRLLDAMGADARFEGAVVCAAADADARGEEAAQVIARRLGLPFASRGRRPLVAMFAEEARTAVLVASRSGVVAVYQRGRRGALVQHPGLALVRCKALEAGGRDRLLAETGIGRGDAVLDCTGGLLGDASVLAWGVGPSGLVCSLESSPAVAYAVHAARTVGPRTGHAAYDEALRRVVLRLGSYRHVLPLLPTAAYDVVYLDPMFGETVPGAHAMQILRVFADETPLAPTDLAQARRVARRWVVIKVRASELRGDPLDLARFCRGRGPILYARVPAHGIAVADPVPADVENGRG